MPLCRHSDIFVRWRWFLFICFPSGGHSYLINLYICYILSYISFWYIATYIVLHNSLCYNWYSGVYIFVIHSSVPRWLNFQTRLIHVVINRLTKCHIMLHVQCITEFCYFRVNFMSWVCHCYIRHDKSCILYFHRYHRILSLCIFSTHNFTLIKTCSNICKFIIIYIY